MVRPFPDPHFPLPEPPLEIARCHNLEGRGTLVKLRDQSPEVKSFFAWSGWEWHTIDLLALLLLTALLRIVTTFKTLDKILSDEKGRTTPLFWRKSRANLVFRMYYSLVALLLLYHHNLCILDRIIGNFRIVFAIFCWTGSVKVIFVVYLVFMLSLEYCWFDFIPWILGHWILAFIRLFLFMHTSVCCHFLNSFYFLGLMSLVI